MKTTTGISQAGQSAFSLKIEDVFNISGRGIVAVGTVESGTVRVGDIVEISGAGKPTIRAPITGVEMLRRKVDGAKAGDNVGLLLGEVKREDLARDMVMRSAGSLNQTLGAPLSRSLAAESSAQVATFGTAGDNLSQAAARAAKGKPPGTIGEQEFRGLGFNGEVAPARSGGVFKLALGLIIVLGIAALAAKMLNAF